MIFNTKVNVVKLLNSKGNVTVLFDKKAKCKLLSGKTKQFRHIQETSPLKNGFVVETVEKVQTPLNLKGLKLSQGLIIPDIDNLQKDLDKLFKEAWDLKSKKAEDLLKSYYITEAYKSFLGVTFRNVFGQLRYVSGALTLNNNYLPITSFDFGKLQIFNFAANLN